MKRALNIGSLVVILSSLVAGTVQRPVQAHGTEQGKAKDLDPVVFQAAGPTAASIQSMVDAFRTAIGGANNGNVAGPIATGRREINWDGGGSTATSIVPTPFEGNNASTVMLFYGIYGDLLYRADVPASEGEASFSFVGVLFDDARVAFVRIRTGDALPGADDTSKRDVIMMDDFIYGEPQRVVGTH